MELVLIIRTLDAKIPDRIMTVLGVFDNDSVLTKYGPKKMAG